MERMQKVHGNNFFLDPVATVKYFSGIHSARTTMITTLLALIIDCFQL